MAGNSGGAPCDADYSTRRHPLSNDAETTRSCRYLRSMTPHTIHELRDIAVTHRIARHVLFAFLITFVIARFFVIFAAEGWLPDLHMSYGDTHVHHLAAGIILLAGVG